MTLIFPSSISTRGNATPAFFAAFSNRVTSVSVNAHLPLATRDHRSNAFPNLACIDHNASAGFECPEMTGYVVWRNQADVPMHAFGSVPVLVEHRRQQQEFCLGNFKRVLNRPWERRGPNNASPVDPALPQLTDDAKIKSIPFRKLPRKALADLTLHPHPLARDRLFD